MIETTFNCDTVSYDLVSNNLSMVKTGFYKLFNSIDDYYRKIDRRTDLVFYTVLFLAIFLQILARKNIDKKFEKTTTNNAYSK